MTDNLKALSGTGADNLKVIREGWVAMLWQAMRKTGEGYRRPKVTRDGRRADKVAAAAKGLSNKLRANLERLGR